MTEVFSIIIFAISFAGQLISFRASLCLFRCCGH